jgi:hypothetical protein
MLEEIVSGVAILVLVIIIVLLGKIPSGETSMIEGGMPDALSQFNQELSQPQPVEYDPSYNFVSTGQVAPNQAVRLDLQADDTVYRQTAGWKKQKDPEEENEGGGEEEDVEVINEGGVSIDAFGYATHHDIDTTHDGYGNLITSQSEHLDPEKPYADGSSMSTLEYIMSAGQGFEKKSSGLTKEQLMSGESDMNMGEAASTSPTSTTSSTSTDMNIGDAATWGESDMNIGDAATWGESDMNIGEAASTPLSLPLSLPLRVPFRVPFRVPLRVSPSLPLSLPESFPKFKVDNYVIYTDMNVGEAAPTSTSPTSTTSPPTSTDIGDAAMYHLHPQGAAGAAGVGGGV